MLAGLLRGRVERFLHLPLMSLAGAVTWHQPAAKTFSSLPRSLNVHAPVFVPRPRAAVLSATGASSAVRSVEFAAAQPAEISYFRPAAPPSTSPCSTSGRDALTQPPLIRSADCGQRQVAFQQPAFLISQSYPANCISYVADYETFAHML